MNGNNGNGGNDFNFWDIFNLISVLIGLQNLYENRDQSAQNDVQSANDKQAQFLLKELTKKFDEQNAMLEKILELLEKRSDMDAFNANEEKNIDDAKGEQDNGDNQSRYL